MPRFSFATKQIFLAGDARHIGARSGALFATSAALTGTTAILEFQAASMTLVA